MSSAYAELTGQATLIFVQMLKYTIRSADTAIGTSYFTDTVRS